MRRVIYLIVIIMIIIEISISVNALEIYNTEIPGENPSIYGSIIAFETHEDHIQKDLNEDGDTGDLIIQYYDIEKQKTINTQTTGKNPSVFANYIIFETNENEEKKDLNNDQDKEDTILQYYDLHEQKVINTKIDAQNPCLYQYFIAFSTPEKSLNIDYNNDGDTNDNVIRYYDIKKQELVTTKQIGDNPSTNGRRILFISEEKQAKIDLNDDGDKQDNIFQIYSLEKKESYSSAITGIKNTMNNQGTAVYIQQGKITFYDAEANSINQTNIEADNCKIKESIVLYDKEHTIYTYDKEKQIKAHTDIYGQKADIFENTIAFQTKEETIGDLNNDGDQKDTIIRYAVSTDEDEDEIIDFLDNCPINPNKNQSDIDNDGIGDECDAKDDRPKKELEIKETIAQDTLKKVETDKEPEPEKEQEETKEKNNFALWFGIIMIIMILFIALLLILPGYLRRRKKSFGFWLIR